MTDYVRMILLSPLILLGWLAFIAWDGLTLGWKFGRFLADVNKPVDN